jgi:adenine-specific DNA-methyltransferase
MTVVTRHFEEKPIFVTPGRDQRRELGQFLTPRPVAEFMASLFESRWRDWSLLDAGAGTGALSAALVKRLCVARHKPKSISVTACEVDETLLDSLHSTLHDCGRECERTGIQFSATVLNQDLPALPTTLKYVYPHF